MIWWDKNEIIIQILLLDLSKKWNFSFIKWFVKSRDFSLLKLSGTEVKSQHRQNWTRNLSYPAVHSLGKPKKLVHVNITYVFKTNILSSVMTKKILSKLLTLLYLIYNWFITCTVIINFSYFLLHYCSYFMHFFHFTIISLSSFKLYTNISVFEGREMDYFHLVSGQISTEVKKLRFVLHPLAVQDSFV